MKQIILLLSVVVLLTLGLLLIREKTVKPVVVSPAPGTAVLNAKKPSRALSKGEVSAGDLLTEEAPESKEIRRSDPAEKPLRKVNSPSEAKLPRLTKAEPRWEFALSRKTEFTPAELLELEKTRKRERRRQGYVKSDSPDEYARLHRMIRTPEEAEAPQYTPDYKLRELYAAQRLVAARRSNVRARSLPWSERGPANVPGRTRGLLVHPANPQRIWFAGSASGGIWKTTDAGGNWVNKTPGLPNLTTTVLAMAPSDPAIIYAGTGEGFFNVDAIGGDGIFKSTDGGDTWQQLTATSGKLEFRNINRIIVDPANSDVVVACSNIGVEDLNQDTENISWIMKSTDGGSSWSPVLALFNRIQQLVASPDNFQVQYGTLEGFGVIKSTDGGDTWSFANNGMLPTGRVEMAIAPTMPSRLYAAAEGNQSGQGGSDLYVSDDAGENWFLVKEAESRPNINWLEGQGWYDNTIAVHPYDANTVYLGGIELWKMTLTGKEDKELQPERTTVEEINTSSFLDFVNLGGEGFDGKLLFGNLPEADFADVEIRFGPGQSQKAHRFTVDGRGAGVPALEYKYRDYVEVPFEVWDITHNRQLMVSFRDQQEDGTFNLLEAGVLPDSTPVQRREYIYIHAVPYAATANANIAQNGGQQYRNMYFLWPVLPEGATWDPGNLPDSKLVIQLEFRSIRLRNTQNLTDYYFRYGGKNGNVHVDHHNLVMIKGNAAARTFKILNANDGGVYVTQTGTDPGFAQGTWVFAGTGYNTTQFYGVDKKRGAEEYLGGTQDNGTWRSPPLEQASASSSYLAQIGGDGFEVSWNYYDPNKLIGSSYGNYYRRSLNGGATWSDATNGLSDQGNLGPFISQIGVSRSNPDVLYATGASGVWRSDDFGGNWKLTPISQFWAYNGLFSDVKVSDANTQIIWAGHAISNTGRVHVSTDGGQTFRATNGYPATALGMISGLATHPTEDSTAYALFSFSDKPKILKTTDLGQTWKDISGFGTNSSSSTGFPDVAVYSLLVLPNDPATLWAGTDIGLVESTDGGATWALAQNGLPAVAVWELKVVDDQVVAATHGRGIWSVTIPELNQPVVFVPFINSLRVGINGKLILDASLRSPYDSTRVYVNNQPGIRIGRTMPKDTIIQISYAEEELVTVQLKSYAAGEEYVSVAKTVDFFLTKPPVYSYGNSFDQPSNDFVGTDFSIRLVPGFADGAIHSPHPYQESYDYIYQLKVPIIIADKNATFRYQDVAITEPGEPGAVFGSPGFYDYVIVEGSKDGQQWKRLEDGYNSDYYPGWRAAYDQGRPGHDSLLVAHNVDILKAFAPGDTVFFRFRLHSDELLTAWGWAIDDLSIQEEFHEVTGFTLVNAATSAEIGLMADQDTLNLNKTGRRLNIKANTFPEAVGSVVFQLNQAVFGIDNQPPYTLAGDNNGQYQAWTPAEGTYTLTATPYAEADGKGKAGTPLTVTFTVIKANEVVDLILVNAQTGRDIRTLKQGDIIDLKLVGRKLNIRSNTLPLLVGSVVFRYDGQTRKENFFPYALGGFNYLRFQYYSWTPTLGVHTLQATPYSRFNGQGQAGIPAMLQFTVVDGQEAAPDNENGTGGNIVAFPNPTEGKFIVDLQAKEDLDVTIQVFDLKGNQVHQQKATLHSNDSKMDIDISALPDGMYFIKTISDRQKFAPFNIIKR